MNMGWTWKSHDFQGTFLSEVLGQVAARVMERQSNKVVAWEMRQEKRVSHLQIQQQQQQQLQLQLQQQLLLLLLLQYYYYYYYYYYY